MIDFRSDTVTQPTEEMRRVMATAPVGDDVFEDDPTVNALEEEIAELLGKEAALFVTSGTQGNLIAVLSQTRPGDEIIVESETHIVHYEVAGAARVGGVQVRTHKGNRGIPDPEQVAALVRTFRDIHVPETALIAVENTHNRAGGVIVPLDIVEQLGSLAETQKVAFHIDGARLWNAAAATGIPEKVWVKDATSVSLCFSKGLGAPVGSILAGSRKLITRARRFRKMLGGGMRQAGILAAAARYAIQNHRTRLVEDHANARYLAEQLGHIRGFTTEPERVDTNILFTSFQHPDLTLRDLERLLLERGVQIISGHFDLLRLVTHLGITRSDIDYALTQLDEITRAK